MLSREGKRSAIIHSILLVVWIGLLVLASFKDLEISKAVSNGDSFLGGLFAVIGEWPSYFIIPIAALILFYNVDRMAKTKSAYITLKIVFGVMHFVGWFLLFFAGEFMPENIAFPFAYASVLSGACLVSANYVDKDFMHKLLKFAVFMLIVLAVSRLIVTIMKMIWSRARFRDMLKYEDFAAFTPWYKPNGYREIEGWKLTSFPSGHVTGATNLFVIVVLCDIFPKLKNKKTLMYIIISMYVALTMFYRIVFNAHFLSDTLWAVLISYLSFYVTKVLFFRGGKYVWNKQIVDDKETPIDETSVEIIDDDVLKVD